MCLYLEKQVDLVFTKEQLNGPASYFQWTGRQEVRSIRGITRRGEEVEEDHKYAGVYLKRRVVRGSQQMYPVVKVEPDLPDL